MTRLRVSFPFGFVKQIFLRYRVWCFRLGFYVCPCICGQFQQNINTAKLFAHSHMLTLHMFQQKGDILKFHVKGSHKGFMFF